MRQQTRMAPRLQQAVKLLQMSALEFASTLHATLASNPFLDDPAEESTGPSPSTEVAYRAGG
ncbi:MAG TPA: RNA polymerase factor sigma-54, partial [Acidovorax sp.]|nr:RNA polymerase factor sigma-54 [Acidovorax sp.]